MKTIVKNRLEIFLWFIFYVKENDLTVNYSPLIEVGAS